MGIIKNKKDYLYFFFILVIVIFLYRGWFNSCDVVRGDWRVRSKDWLDFWLNKPYGWQNSELGGSPTSHNGIILRYPIWFVQSLLINNGIKRMIVEKILWFWLFLFLSIISMFSFSKYLLE